MVILNCNKICKKINGINILSDISFEIQSNSINFIIGPNGAGKTSLGKILSGDDLDYTGGLTSFAGKIKFIPHKLELNSYLPLTVYDFFKLTNDVTCAKLKQFLGYEEIINIQLLNLSAGKLQKLLLVHALNTKNNMTIFDEPTNSLDPDSTIEFFKLLKSYDDTTFIVISHDLHIVSSFADKVICINKHVCCIKTMDFSNTDFTRYYHNHDHKHD